MAGPEHEARYIARFLEKNAPIDIPRDKPALELALEDLGKAVESLAIGLGALETRLQSVLTPPVPRTTGEGNMAGGPPVSRATAAVRVQSDRVRELEHNIGLLIGRLEA